MLLPLRRLLVGCVLLGSFLGSCALAQPQGVLELGFGGETVTERWNPLRLTLRDVRSAELTIRIDQGSLQSGESLVVYRADVNSGGGVSVFEDELFLPQWRYLSWRLEAPDRLVTSGTLDRRRLDPRPLTLVVSAAPGRWRGFLSELPVEGTDEPRRSIDVPPSLLPERLAAYDGVSTVLIDGTAAMPDLETLLAAASAGADVVALEPLPSSHGALESLVAPGITHLGAGRLIRVPEARLAQVLGRAPLPDLSAALLTEDLSALPQRLEPLPVLIAVGLYLLAVLLLIRLAGAPGLVASLALATLASVAAWSYLRPEPSQTLRGRSLVVSGGALARQSEVRTVFTLPQNTLQLDSAARPLSSVPYLLGKNSFELSLERWQRQAISLKPRLVEASLRWSGATSEGAELSNLGSRLLQDVYVKGVGTQASLAPGEEVVPSIGEDAPLPEVYAGLLEHVPPGTALARDGGVFHVSLPPFREP